MQMDTLEMPLQISDKMIQENLIADKNREIRRLREVIGKIPRPLPESEWLNHLWNCNHVSDCLDKLVELGYAIRE